MDEKELDYIFHAYIETTIEHETIIRDWVKYLRKAFYGPSTISSHRNKFNELGKIIDNVFISLIPTFNNHVWRFGMDVLIFLLQNYDDIHEEESEETLPVKQYHTMKKTKSNAPITYIFVKSLHKLQINMQKSIALDQQNDAEEEMMLIDRYNALRDICEENLKQRQLIEPKHFVEVLSLLKQHTEPFESELIEQVAMKYLNQRENVAVINIIQLYHESILWDYKEILREIVRSKDCSSAETFAQKFKDKGSTCTELSSVLIEEIIALGDLKRAHRLVYALQLQDIFPDIEGLYKHNSLMKFIEKRQWHLARNFVGADTTCQEILLQQMLILSTDDELDECEKHSQYLAQMLQVADFDFHKSRSEIQQKQMQYYENYDKFIDFNLSMDEIIFCDTEELIRKAASDFFPSGSDHTKPMIVGLDVEWQPISLADKWTTELNRRTKSASRMSFVIASILQIATASRVYIIDMLSLHDCSYLNEFCYRLCRSPEIIKVGFGFDNDLKVLHHTMPDTEAFHEITSYIEISNTYLLGAYFCNSLSALAVQIFGKPLDKQMQLSNWNQRPLSRAQIVYAAYDAYILLHLLQQIHQGGDLGCNNLSPISTLQNLTLSSQELTKSERMAKFITTLRLKSPLDAATQGEAIKYKQAYIENWLGDKSCNNNINSASPDILAIDDVTSFWDKQIKRIRNQTNVATSVYPSLQVVELEEKQQIMRNSSSSKSFVFVNTICFFVNGIPSVACINSNNKLDTSVVASIYGTRRRYIKFATADECIHIFGYKPGSIPPFGHKKYKGQDISIYGDSDLVSYYTLFTGSGVPEKLLQFTSEEFFRVVPITCIDKLSSPKNREKQSIELGVDLKRMSIEDTSIDFSTDKTDRFLADSMLTRVGRWLRSMGIDIVIWDQYTTEKYGSATKEKMLDVAHIEHRIIITRDKYLAARRDAACFVVSCDDPDIQFQEIIAHFQLTLNENLLMSRCAQCNSLELQIVDRSYVKEHMNGVVPEKVFLHQQQFWLCNECKKVFWVGPSYRGAIENVVSKFNKLKQ